MGEAGNTGNAQRRHERRQGGHLLQRHRAGGVQHAPLHRHILLPANPCGTCQPIQREPGLRRYRQDHRHYNPDGTSVLYEYWQLQWVRERNETRARQVDPHRPVRVGPTRCSLPTCRAQSLMPLV